MTTTISAPRSGHGGRYPRRLEHWTHVRICRCGYATPITTDAIARFNLARHRCRGQTPAPVQLELPFDLPDIAAASVVRYLADRRRNTRLDVDAVAVRRFINGDHTLTLNVLERVAVYTLLRSHGISRAQCAVLLRLSWSTQARYRRLEVAA
jgi:hypothetical protein